MIEDDTFRVLKRIPIQDMISVYMQLDDISYNRMTEAECEKFFSDRGWTELEFKIAWKKYLEK